MRSTDGYQPSSTVGPATPSIPPAPNNAETQGLSHDNQPDNQSRAQETLLKVTQLMRRLQNAFDSDPHNGISTVLESTELDHEVVYTCASLFWTQFQTDSGTLEELDIAIDLGARALQLVSDHDPQRPRYLFALGSFHQMRFKRVGKVEDITEAIQLIEQAVLLAPSEHTSKPRFLSNLDISYTMRFHRLNTPADMEKSIEFQKQAVRLTPGDLPEMLARLSNLGGAYRTLFERLGRVEDLEKSPWKVGGRYQSSGTSNTLLGSPDSTFGASR
ncbi:hypothetical protein FRC12_017941 [Ceratobasidium sp. 428]|nr:hypothetical protein FRC12_017941 [Ceratobasidium sp. 428]